MKGWTVGTLISGKQSDDVAVIKITAIGEGAILARRVSANGSPSDGRELTWTLADRDWEAER